MLKRESGVRKAMGSYRTYSIPSKIAALVPEFVVEDLPSAELQPRFLCLQSSPTRILLPMVRDPQISRLTKWRKI